MALSRSQNILKIARGAVSHARKTVRQMLDTLESTALYIIFIPHTLVCSGSLCGEIGRETR